MVKSINISTWLHRQILSKWSMYNMIKIVHGLKTYSEYQIAQLDFKVSEYEKWFGISDSTLQLTIEKPSFVKF